MESDNEEDTFFKKKPKEAPKPVEETKAEAVGEPATATAAGPDPDADPSKLDFRVGIIRKCWEHPEAEKLLCEEIDIGEPTGPRTIASGLKAFYTPAQMEGRKVIVLSNLKERTMVGFKSQVTKVFAYHSDV